MKPKISVIVPIYNTEKYLDKCLTSILNQTMQEIEIICVDDCSSDDSCLIVEKFIEQDSRLSLIRHKENKGPGGARNTGILAARADFLASVDSDDYIKPEMMKTLWDASENGKFDIVCCGFKVVNEEGREVSSSNIPPQTIQNASASVNIFSLMGNEFWNKLWRKTLFIDNGLLFPENLYFEDAATTPRLLAKSETIIIIEKYLYSYLRRPDSITRTHSAKHILDGFKVLEIHQEFLEVNDLLNRHKENFNNYLKANLIYHSNRVLNSNMSQDEINQYLRYILMLRVDFSYYRDKLSQKDQQDILDLIRTPNSIKVRILSRFYKLLVTKKQYIKLQNNPGSFFRDSKSRFTRAVGNLFNLR